MTYNDFINLLYRSKRFTMDESILNIEGYYGMDKVSLDLSKLSEEEFERIRIKKRRAIDIEWDFDGEDGEDIDLPTEFDIPDNITDEEVSDWLSDQTGFCNLGFKIEEMEDK